MTYLHGVFDEEDSLHCVFATRDGAERFRDACADKVPGAAVRPLAVMDTDEMVDWAVGWASRMVIDDPKPAHVPFKSSASLRLRTPKHRQQNWSNAAWSMQDIRNLRIVVS